MFIAQKNILSLSWFSVSAVDASCLCTRLSFSTPHVVRLRNSTHICQYILLVSKAYHCQNLVCPSRCACIISYIFYLCAQMLVVSVCFGLYIGLDVFFTMYFMYVQLSLFPGDYIQLSLHYMFKAPHFLLSHWVILVCYSHLGLWTGNSDNKACHDKLEMPMTCTHKVQDQGWRCCVC